VTLASARAWLDRARTSDGAWGYGVGAPAAPEPTLLACAAGLPVPVAWLESAALGWSALLLPAALRGRPEATDLRTAALAQLLEWDPGLVPITSGSFDGRLRGWSWVQATFSWVEPTLWAVLSLRGVAGSVHPRLTEGFSVLADRQGLDGGWNAGNPDVLGTPLPSYSYLTGLVLLALPAGHPAVPAAAGFLDSLTKQPSVYGLSAAVLGGLAHGLDTTSWAVALAALQDPDGGFSARVDRTALAACALSAQAGAGCPLLLDAVPRG
jgi:hypothetical protein